jgi:hypothetical protein
MKCLHVRIRNDEQLELSKANTKVEGQYLYRSNINESGKFKEAVTYIYISMVPFEAST